MYKLLPDPKQRILVYSSDGDADMMLRFSGAEGEQIERPLMVVFDSEINGYIADFMYLGNMKFLIRPDLARQLKIEVEGFDLIPAKCDFQDCFYVNVFMVSDELDVENSQLKRFTTGRIQDIVIHKWRKVEQVNRTRLFKLKNMETIGIYCDDSFRSFYLNNGWSGIMFQEVS